MNEMKVGQSAAILNAVVEQMTGQAPITAITTPEDIVTVAQTALRTGYDPVINAVSQVWSRTIFAVRDYRAPLDSLRMDIERWGNVTRKLSPVSAKMANDQRFAWPVGYDTTRQPPLGNGQSVDHYKLAKQEVLQTNFYGSSAYEQTFTIFKDQFDTAFQNAEEFARFNAMNMTERYNDRESYREGIARALQANYVGAIIDEGQNGRVIHLLQEYNDQTGLQLTAQDIYKPDNFAPFMRWVYARIRSLAKLFRERSQLFQTVINEKPILRHTPAEKLRVALYDPAMEQMRAMVNSTTFHDEYLEGVTWEGITYWQNIETPDSIAIQPVYTATNGTVKKADETLEQAGIFGVIHDVDALGYAITNEWSAVTPLNINGGYWNEAYHSTFKTVSDMTEKGVVLLLD